MHELEKRKYKSLHCSHIISERLVHFFFAVTHQTPYNPNLWSQHRRLCKLTYATKQTYHLGKYILESITLVEG